MVSPVRDADSKPETLPWWRRSWVAALVLVALGLVAYHNSFRVPFVFDDDLVIYQNPSIHSLATSLFPPQHMEMGGLPISGRPVVNLSIALNYAFSGTNVLSYHVVNLAIHLLCALLLFAIVRHTLRTPPLVESFGARAVELALLIAALWLVHPLQTESVTYISQRAESLVGLTYLLTLWCYLHAATPKGVSKVWSFAAFAACLLGMATKEVMVSAPLFVALYDRAFLSSSWRDVWARRRNLLLALASTWALLAWIVLSGGGQRGLSAGFGLGVSGWSYLLKQCDALVLYLKLSFWPAPLVLDYGTSVVHHLADVWWQAGLILLLLMLTVWAIVRKPIVGCAGAWFFMILAPTSSFVPLVGQTVAEHRMYLPLAALIALVLLVVYHRVGAKSLAIFALAIGPLTYATIQRNEDYSTTIRICEDTVAKNPGNSRAMALLATYHHQAGHLREAREWLERSLARTPGVVPVLNNLGHVLQELGETDQAIITYRRALAVQPENVDSLNNLGTALIFSGQTEEGLAQLQAALRASPNATAIRENFSNALARAGRMEEAAAQFQILVAAVPDDADARLNLSDALLALGRKAEATTELEAAVRLRPNDAELRNQLGTALARAGRLDDALAHFREAVRLKPDFAAARANAERAERMLAPR